MADSYVCSGATMKCTMGDKAATLTVLPSRTVFLCGKPMANISDHTPMVNLAPFGKCRSLAYPATAAATAAHLGKLTPMPCVHNTPMPWVPGKPDYLIQGQPALLKSCKCTCMWGGMISLVDDGQLSEGTQYVGIAGKTSVDNLNNTSLPSAESVLNGIQLALDVAGFAPGVGAIPDLLNAGISALRGNWAEAGLSVLAAVPIIGDVAAGTKMAKKGLKIAKMAKKSVSRNIDLSINALVKRGMSPEEAKLFGKTVREERKKVAKDFYEKNAKEWDGSKMVKWEDSRIEAHLQGIDFNKPVKVEKIPPAGQKEITLYQNRYLQEKTGKDIAGEYTTLEYKAGNYYTTNPNALPRELGTADTFSINVSKAPNGTPQQLGLPFPKQQFTVKITEETPCLRSTAKRMEDTWSMPGQSITTEGGAEQLFIPNVKPITN